MNKYVVVSFWVTLLVLPLNLWIIGWIMLGLAKLFREFTNIEKKNGGTVK